MVVIIESDRVIIDLNLGRFKVCQNYLNDIIGRAFFIFFTTSSVSTKTANIFNFFLLNCSMCFQNANNVLQ